MEPLEPNLSRKFNAGESAAEPTQLSQRARAARASGRHSDLLLVVLVGVLGIRTFVAEATVIPTGSMEKTILIGDHVFLNKLLYGPRIPYTNCAFHP